MSVSSKFVLRVLTGTSVAMFAGAPATAAVITVTNPSFELYSISADNSWAYPNTGWSGPGNGAFTFHDPNSARFTGTSGSPGQGVLPNGRQIALPAAGILQTFAANSIIPNTDYTLSFYVGDAKDLSAGTVTAALYDDGVQFATLTVTDNDDAGAATVPNPVPTDTFVQFSLVGSTGPTASGVLSIGFTSNGGNFIDQVSLSSAAIVPEPTTFVGLIGITTFGLLTRRRRRVNG